MDYVNLSDSPLKTRTKEFLKSEKGLGFNKSQLQDDIANLLDKSMRLIFNILKDGYNLRTEDIYAKFNASSLYPILELFLRDHKISYDVKTYDFRTVELARLMFIISTNYLRYSYLFKDAKYAHEDIDRVKERFLELSKSALEKVAYGTTSKKEFDKLKAKQYEIRKWIDDLKTDLNSDWSKNSKEYERLTSMRANIDHENQDFVNIISQLKKETQDLEKTENKPHNEVNKLKIQIQKKISRLKERLKENQEIDNDLHRKVLRVQKLRDDSVKQFENELKQVGREISQQFEHLNEYFCPYPGERLEQFVWQKNAHLPDNDSWQEQGAPT